MVLHLRLAINVPVIFGIKISAPALFKYRVSFFCDTDGAIFIQHENVKIITARPCYTNNDYYPPAAAYYSFTLLFQAGNIFVVHCFYVGYFVRDAGVAP